MNVAICVPIYNDWTCASLLLERIDAMAAGLPHRFELMFIDDGSSDEVLRSLPTAPSALVRVSVLRLRRNVGHQRAIAIGLAHLHARNEHDALVVMDGDGEDRAEDIPSLLSRCEATGMSSVVFAQRTKRTEGTTFRLGYAAFKLMHLALVGKGIDVGNFSVIPRAALVRLVVVAELWNHYAAAVHHARLPITSVPTSRAPRLAGESKMNFGALVVHGLSAISVYSDIVGVRLLRLVALCAAGVLAGIAAVIAIRLFTTLAIPGWATNATGMLVMTLLNLTMLSMFMALFTLRSRTEYGFLPLRDYAHFVLEELKLTAG